MRTVQGCWLLCKKVFLGFKLLFLTGLYEGFVQVSGFWGLAGRYGYGDLPPAWLPSTAREHARNTTGLKVLLFPILNCKLSSPEETLRKKSKVPLT